MLVFCFIVQNASLHSDLFTGSATFAFPIGVPPHSLGTTVASRTGSNSSTGPGTVRWALDRVTDSSGNAVVYTYVADQGELYLDRIDYTSNGSIPAAHFVRFYREARSDVTALHHPGFTMTTAFRLKTIDIVASSGRAGAYRLSYTTSPKTQRSLLTSIQRFGSDASVDAAGTITAGSGFPATTFTFDGGTAGFPTSTSGPAWSDTAGWSLAQYYASIQFADINGDGRADLCGRNGNGVLCHLATSTGFAAGPISGPSWGTGWDLPQYYATVQFPDINGDGKADVCGRSSSGIVCYLSTGTGFSTTAISGPAWSDAGGWGQPQYYSTIRFADINGDGKADVCARITSGIVCHLSTGTGFSTTAINGPAWSDAANWNLQPYYATIQFPDINGDGKADVCARNSIGILCHVSTGTGFSTTAINGPAWPDTGGWNQHQYYSTIQFPDVNGDGKADVCARNTYGILCHVSSGTEFSATQITGPGWTDQGNWNQHQYYSTIQFPDINGDGKADVCARNMFGIVCHVSTGNGFGAELSGPTWFPDFTGDAKTDVCARSSLGITCYRATEDGVESLKTVANGLGGQATLSYTPSSQYVNDNLPFVVWTVSSSTVSDGLGWSASTTYAYQGGRWSAVDREFRGFGQVTATDPIGTRSITGFHQDDVKKGQVSWTRTQTSGAQDLTLVTHTYTDQQPFPGVFWPRIEQTDTTEYGAPSRQTSVTLEYDQHGNVTRTYRWGDVAVTGDERDELTEWAINSSAWIHRPFHTVLLDPVLGVLREKWIYYDNLPLGQVGSKGLATREENRLAGVAGNPGNPAVTHTYDATTGQRLTTTDPRNCSLTTVYGANRYPSSVTTCLGHTTTFTYDTRWGAKLSETDPNGQTTTFTYDVFGRITKVTGPLDTSSLYGSVSYQYLDFGTPSTQRIKTLKTTKHGWSEFWWSEQYFDGLGRIDKTVTPKWPDTIETNVAFDTRGLVSAKSAPHIPGETIRWTQFQYDALGRQISVQNPDVKTVTPAEPAWKNTPAEGRSIPVSATFEGDRIVWAQAQHRWADCVRQLETLLSSQLPGHQYLTEEGDGILVTVQFKE